MKQHHYGFTLIELVMVLVLVGILSYYAVTRWPSNHELKLPSQVATFVHHIQQAKFLATLWGQPLRIQTSAAGYSVSCVNFPASSPCDVNPVNNPATGATFNINLESGISLSVNNVEFDSLGRPVSAGVLVQTQPASSFNMTAGSVTKSINVSRLSGLVSVSP